MTFTFLPGALALFMLAGMAIEGLIIAIVNRRARARRTSSSGLVRFFARLGYRPPDPRDF